MPRPVRKRPAPLSIRLNDDERRALAQRAGDIPVSTYVKRLVFQGGTTSLAGNYSRRPTTDRMILAKLLAILGSTDLASNLDRLASAATEGSLFVDERVTAQLQGACDDVRLMHNALMRALGKRERGPSAHEIKAAAEFNTAAGESP